MKILEQAASILRDSKREVLESQRPLPEEAVEESQASPGAEDAGLTPAEAAPPEPQAPAPSTMQALRTQWLGAPAEAKARPAKVKPEAAWQLPEDQGEAAALSGRAEAPARDATWPRPVRLPHWGERRDAASPPVTPVPQKPAEPADPADPSAERALGRHAGAPEAAPPANRRIITPQAQADIEARAERDARVRSRENRNRRIDRPAPNAAGTSLQGRLNRRIQSVRPVAENAAGTPAPAATSPAAHEAPLEGALGDFGAELTLDLTPPIPEETVVAHHEPDVPPTDTAHGSGASASASAPVTDGPHSPRRRSLLDWLRPARPPVAAAPAPSAPDPSPAPAAPAPTPDEIEQLQFSLGALDWDLSEWPSDPAGATNPVTPDLKAASPLAEPLVDQRSAWASRRPNFYDRVPVVTAITDPPSEQDLLDWAAARQMGQGRQLGRRPEYLEQALFNLLHQVLGAAEPVSQIDASGARREVFTIDAALHARCCAQLDQLGSEELIFGSLLSARSALSREPRPAEAPPGDAPAGDWRGPHSGD